MADLFLHKPNKQDSFQFRLRQRQDQETMRRFGLLYPVEEESENDVSHLNANV